MEYGLSTTSLSSLLQASTHNSKEARTSTRLHQKNNPASSTSNAPTSTESSKEIAPTSARQTYGLEILAHMSEREYRVFLRASEGLSDVEKMAAAQALYVFTQKAKPSTAHKEANINSLASSATPTSPINSPNNASTPQAASLSALPPTPNNPYFSGAKSFIARFIALYHGAQEVDITS